MNSQSNNDLLEALRSADWSRARELLSEAESVSSDLIGSTSLWLWLVEENAAPGIVSLAIRKCASVPSQLAATETLARCMALWTTRSSARGTFREILHEFQGANGRVSDGNSLLQEAIRLNKPECALMLVEAGADAGSLSSQGEASTTALEDALVARNEAAAVVLRAIGKTEVARYLRSQRISLRSIAHPARSKFEYYGWLPGRAAADPLDIWDYAFGDGEDRGKDRASMTPPT